MSTMSQNQNTFIPRKGQQDLIKALPDTREGDQLSVQWPTGYGKSIGFALAWKHCYNTGLANRLLIVVANDTQRQQMVNDFAGDCKMVGAPCHKGVWAIDREGTTPIKATIDDGAVFICTVQQLDSSRRSGDNGLIKSLMQISKTKWMVGFDEYHHYGEGMSWGDSAKEILKLSKFTAAMSATPYRRTADLIFNEPKLVVTYTEAVEEGAVKRMICHAYDYKVTVLGYNDDPTNYTTSELLDMVDDKIDVWEERCNIRYSPQYLHPLIIEPLARLDIKRVECSKAQMLVRAMSCNHAKAVCEQIKVFSGGKSVDWIGTGYNGRSNEENRAALDRFCPPKINGTRPDPTLDILVQVSMAGEGFDSINVCEIIDFFPVSKKARNGRATQDKQFYGRGARRIPNATGLPVHINVPTDHPLHEWGGKVLHEWMDACGGDTIDPPKEPEPDDSTIEDCDFPPFPKDRDIELISVTRDDEKFKSFHKRLSETFRFEYDPSDDYQVMSCIEAYKDVSHRVVIEESEKTKIARAREYNDAIAGKIAYNLARRSKETNGSTVGRFKKEVAALAKKHFNKSVSEMMADELVARGEWLRLYLQSMKGGAV